MQFDLGLQAMGIVLIEAIIFGVIAQFILGARTHTNWLWLIGAAGWVVGAVFLSEVTFATATEEELQPIIDGLAFDEALLGGLIGGLIAVALTWLAIGRRPTHHPTAPSI